MVLHSRGQGAANEIEGTPCMSCAIGTQGAGVSWIPPRLTLRARPGWEPVARRAGACSTVKLLEESDDARKA